MHIAKGMINYSEDYICKVVANIEEATKLIENGFEYVMTFDNKMLYRKRKYFFFYFNFDFGSHCTKNNIYFIIKNNMYGRLNGRY